MAVDPALLAVLQRPENAGKLAEMLAVAASANRPVTVDWIKGELSGKKVAGLILKRTYVLADGRLEIDAEGQEVLWKGELGYLDDTKQVRLSPPIFVNDYYVARQKTDVVVQGFVYAPRPGTRKLSAKVRFGKNEREIVVFGERRGEFDRAGRPRFSEPKPFEMLPLRYDFAYGGVDMVALARKLGYPEPGAAVALPRETELHYPRNPCGFGYLIELDRESFTGLRIPHLEHPFDPLTPARLAVGKPDRWLRAPLPAAWDWQSELWFPRCAYLGSAPAFAKDGTIPAEIERGWAPKDILDIPSIFHDLDGPPRAEYAQAASPGMSVDLAADELFEFENLHPQKSSLSIRLPGEVPMVKVAFRPEAYTDLEPRLLSVVLRPDRGEVVTTWRAVAEVDREYERLEMMGLRSEIRWVRGGTTR